MTSAMPTIKIVLKVFYQMANAETPKFEVVMTSLLLILK